jgi:hypothetical protein
VSVVTNTGETSEAGQHSPQIRSETNLNSANIPVKTPDGLAELHTRRRRLSQRHRTLLLLVDGRRGEAQVRAMGAQAGVPDSCFSDLLAFGLIEMREPAATPIAPDRPDGAAARRRRV